MQICFFEDTKCKNFKPLTLTRPTWDLRIGILTIYQKWEKMLHPELIVWNTEEHLKDVFKTPDLIPSKPCWHINSRVLPSKELIQDITKLNPGDALFYENELIAFCSEDGLDINLLDNLKPSKKIQLDKKLSRIEYVWDLLSLNASQIEVDIELLKDKPIHEEADSTVIIKHPENIYIHSSAKIEPGVILIAENGPIYIGEGALIEAGAVLKGPVAVCKNATVKLCGRIYDGTTIGPDCKVGGEVTNSIFHSFSNKAHDGYVGKSIFGQWCNLGADTNTSNLKNNYGLVTIKDWETKRSYDTGIQFFGTVMGDHSKTSINTMLNTGTTCGVSANIFQSGFPPRYIQSFTWIDGQRNPRFRFDKALEAMEAMMARRDKVVTPEYAKMVEYLFEIREN